jgi:hypothetical protein
MAKRPSKPQAIFLKLKLQFHTLVFDTKLILLLKEETGERSGNWFAADADRKSFLVLIETKFLVSSKIIFGFNRNKIFGLNENHI